MELTKSLNNTIKNNYNTGGNIDYKSYLNAIIHNWSKTLASLAYTLVPLFFILDYFTMPTHLLPRFAFYRAFSTLIPICLFLIIKKTKPSKYSYIHVYIMSIVVGGAIALMTVDLGGFNSRYYAGLNLIIIGIGLLLPWKYIHSLINGSLLIIIYVILNLVSGQEYLVSNLISNLFFLISTVIIAVSINNQRHKLFKQEFILRSELQVASNALWGEMAVAKKIQTSLLPKKYRTGSYQIAATMLPAREVGGDYYDIIETLEGEKWITIGDVSGHGLESGLIMMMTQTSFFSVLNNTRGIKPSAAIEYVNSVISQNIAKLHSNRYMTILAIKLKESQINVAGKHQDLLIYRTKSKTVEVIPTTGTWIGLANNIGEFLEDISIDIALGDYILLFTDGITEASNKNGEMFGYERLVDAVKKYGESSANEILSNIIHDVNVFQKEQNDDMTLLVIKKVV